MWKNEQSYRLLNKFKINHLLYYFLRKKSLIQGEESFLLSSKDISLLRADMASSCIIVRNENWIQADYDLDLIIPVYNTGSMLEECIKSVLQQSTQYKCKVIVIDDGSTDKLTLDVLSSYENTLDNIIVIHTENHGLSAARNKGIEVSRGRYLFFLDSDDIIEPNAIEVLMSAAIAEDADIVEGSYVNISEKGKQLQTFIHKSGLISDNDDMYGYAWGKVFKRSLFFGVQFPKYIFEDSVVKTVLYPLSNKMVGIRDITYGYRRNKKSISFTSQGNDKSLDSYWVARQLNIDRNELGIVSDQSYYEYMLKCIKRTFKRNIHLSDEYHLNLFQRWCDEMEEFSDYCTHNDEMRDLELAIRTKNYQLYKSWNTMKMF